MAKYVDIECAVKQLTAVVVSDDLLGMGVQTGINHAMKILGQLRIVDAVEVVRCEGCRWGEPLLGTWDNKVWCGYRKCFCSEDDFCSWGERRTDD